MTTLRPLEGIPNQYEEDVESFQHFNGATCLVIVDVTALGQGHALREVMAGRPGPTDAQLGDLIEAEIRRQIQACPQGANAKVQLLYHATPKPLPVGKAKSRDWQMQDSIRHALRKFQQNNEPRFKKLFLCGCHSHQNDRDLVAEAFKIPSIERVVTFWEIIFLTPGRVGGADLGFRNRPLHIYVWKKDAQGRQIAEKPARPIEADEELDLGTLYVEKRTAAAPSRCPTQHARSGSGWERAGVYPSIAAAQNAILAFSGSITPFPQTFALRDAQEDLAAFTCPNASCQSKTLSAVTVTNYTWSIRTSIARSVLSFLTFGLVRQWVLFINYDWSSRITCS